MQDISLNLLLGQLVIGVINGSFYAMMSLGLAIIFGLLNIANFFHGVQFMLGAFVAWFLLSLPTQFPGLGLPPVNYWFALIIAPILVGGMGIIFERLLFRRLYDVDHMYGFLLTLGMALIFEGLMIRMYGATGHSYSPPPSLRGAWDLGVLILPIYRVWVILASVIVCFATWYAIERTRLGASLRAATENPPLVRAFGIDVNLLIMLSYSGGAALAAVAGVLSAPIFQFNPLVSSDIIIIVFAVVVIGGIGSILGTIVSGFGIGIIEGLTKAFYPEGSSVVIYVCMAAVLLFKPTGLFGKAA